MSTQLAAMSTRDGRCRVRMMRAAIAAVLLGAIASPALAQYNAGSSGVHGAFPPAPLPSNAAYVLWNLKTGLVRYCTTYDTTARPDACTSEISSAQIQGIPSGGLTTGIYEFTNFDLTNPGTVISVVHLYPVGYLDTVPLTILSQDVVRLNRIFFHLEGLVGLGTQTGLPPTGYGAPGGRGGPGGFAGGNGGKMGAPSTPGNPGFGPAGGAGGGINGVNQQGADASQVTASTSLVPLTGGSGGGGGGAWDTSCGFRGGGGGGGGGGGAVLIAANNQIVLSTATTLDARGAAGGDGCNSADGGRGGGGTLRLASSTLSGNPQIFVGSGIVRIEANAPTFTGSIDTVRGTVLAAPQPAIPAAVPTLRITSVGGIAVGQNPTGSLSTPDVTFASPPSGPQTINLAASDVPLGTTVTVRAVPLIGSASSATSSALTGTMQSSTATASLAIPAGAGVITAVTSFPVTSALLDRLPRIPGLTPALIEVTADATGISRTFVIGKDSRRVELRLGTDGNFVAVF